MDPNFSKYVEMLMEGSSSQATPTSSQNTNFQSYSQSQNPNFQGYSQSSCYVDPYETRSYDPNGTCIPPSQLFSTHCAMENPTMAPPTRTPEASKKRRPDLVPLDLASKLRRAWVVAEDKALIGAYLNTSNDSIVGIDQSGTTFWQKVASSFAAGNTIATGERDKTSCKNRWHAISASVSKFVGAYKQAMARKTSGQNENDVLLCAHSIYEADMGKKFILEHAWCMLKNEPKWTLTGEESASKRYRLNQQGNFSSCSDPGTPNTPCTPSTPSSVNPAEDAATQDQAPPVRPIGVKAAKRKAKEKTKGMPTVNEGAPGERAMLTAKIADAQTDLAGAIRESAKAKTLTIY